MYDEFIEDFHKAAVPFLDPEVYGRSIYENSSFIASSKNPNTRFHGKGFVARLSGSTVEFIHMWSLMMFGLHPFSVKEGELQLTFAPVIPDYLIGDDLSVSAVFLGSTQVIYHLAKQKDHIPGAYEIRESVLYEKDGGCRKITGATITGADAAAVRDGKVERIEVMIG